MVSGNIFSPSAKMSQFRDDFFQSTAEIFRLPGRKMKLTPDFVEIISHTSNHATQPVLCRINGDFPQLPAFNVDIRRKQVVTPDTDNLRRAACVAEIPA